MKSEDPILVVSKNANFEVQLGNPTIQTLLGYDEGVKEYEDLLDVPMFEIQSPIIQTESIDSQRPDSEKQSTTRVLSVHDILKD